ncbi:MAG: inorganic diphosphatase, partial [Candidatus Marsarchaeota archaeon]|nr:inorganic diphosphatase [Candidatus Marsarchaeota archaeon]
MGNLVGFKSKEKYTALIEVVSGSTEKYALDPKTNTAILERILPVPLLKNMNYGFLMDTLSCDSDPLDVIILSGIKLDMGQRVNVVPVGIIFTADEGGLDPKIVAVYKRDKVYGNVSDIGQIDKKLFEEICNYLLCSKTLPGSWIEMHGAGGHDQASLG